MTVVRKVLLKKHLIIRTWICLHKLCKFSSPVNVTFIYITLCTIDCFKARSFTILNMQNSYSVVFNQNYNLSFFCKVALQCFQFLLAYDFDGLHRKKNGLEMISTSKKVESQILFKMKSHQLICRFHLKHIGALNNNH